MNLDVNVMYNYVSSLLINLMVLWTGIHNSFSLVLSVMVVINISLIFYLFTMGFVLGDAINIAEELYNLGEKS